MNLKRVQDSASVLAILFSVSFFAACGQNPHVTGSDPAAGGSSGGDSSSIQSQEAPVVTAEPTPDAQALVMEPKDGGDKKAKESEDKEVSENSGKETETTEIVEVEKELKAEELPLPVIPPVVVVNGKDGEKGKDGERGQDGKDNCVSFTQPVTGEALNPKEMTDLENSTTELPYALPLASKKKNARRKPSVKLLTLNQGQVRGTGKFCTGAHKDCFVKDAMVAFRFKTTLPPRNEILNKVPVTATIVLDIEKISRSAKTFDSTEIFCFLNTRMCSGQTFLSPAEEKALGMKAHARMDWSNLVNGLFFENRPADQRTINHRFSEILKTAAEKFFENEGSKRRRINYAQQLSLDLADVLAPEGKTLSQEELLDVLYGEVTTLNIAVKRDLKFMVADDILVKSAELKLNYAYNSCSLGSK